MGVLFADAVADSLVPLVEAAAASEVCVSGAFLVLAGGTGTFFSAFGSTMSTQVTNFAASEVAAFDDTTFTSSVTPDELESLVEVVDESEVVTEMMVVVLSVDVTMAVVQ